MDPNLTLPSVQENLRREIDHHRQQEALHAEREAFHRDQRTAHAAEIETLTRHLEALDSVAAVAVDLAARAQQAAPQPEVILERRVSLTVAVRRVIEGKGLHEPFDPQTLAAEVHQRFGDRLKRPADPRFVSAALRRMARSRRIFLFEKGKPWAAARYVRALPQQRG